MLLRYIPEDPTFVPPPETGEACGSLLAEATGRPASARRIEGVELVAPAGPFVAIRCPACGADLAADWWRQRLEGARETGYVELGVTVPCCGAETSLHDLDYEPPAGFARFVLQVTMDSGVEERVDVDALESALGAMLRRVV